MKNFILSLILLACGTYVYAQDDNPYESTPLRQDPQKEIQTLSKSPGHSGGYGGFFFKGTEMNGNFVALMGLKGGWTINRAMTIGLEMQGVIPSAKYDGIHFDPTRKAILLGGYGGMFIEPVLMSNKVIHITFPIAAGAGWLGYHDDWEDPGYWHYNTLIDEDVFWYVEPGIGLELNVTRIFRINLGASYRFAQDLELVNTPADAFDQMNYSITFKFGKF